MDLGIGEYLGDLVRQPIVIEEINEQPVLAVFDDFFHRRRVRRDQQAACRHDPVLTDNHGAVMERRIHDENISKKIDELHNAVQRSLTESKEETLNKISELESKIEETREALLNKTSELETKYSEFGQKFEASKQRLSELEIQFEKINSADAVKKSAGLDQSGKVEQKPTSFWGGTFSG